MPTKSPSFVAPSECPICGADVPKGAHACPQCGADERTGWSEESTRYDGLDLPEAAFEEDVTPDKRMNRRTTSTGLSTFWWVVGVGISLLFIYLVFTAKF